jgi:hypothetical protein
MVPAAERFRGDASSSIEIEVGLILGIDLSDLGLGGRDQLFFVDDRLVRGTIVRLDVVRRNEEAAQLISIDGFEILDRHLVAAGLAHVFG